MPHLVDTNRLLCRAQIAYPQCAATTEALISLRPQGEELWISPQKVVEFWSVATWPQGANGLHLPPEEAEVLTAELEQLFQILPETPDNYRL